METGRTVTLGLFYFIGSANSHTYALTIHSALTRLGWLVCYFSVSFTNHVNSQLRQQDPWRRHGSEIVPSGSEISLRFSKNVWAYGCTSWILVSPNSLNKGFNQHPTSHPSLPPTPLSHANAFLHVIHDSTVVMKKVAQNLAGLANYIAEIVIKH